MPTFVLDDAEKNALIQLAATARIYHDALDRCLHPIPLVEEEYKIRNELWLNAYEAGEAEYDDQPVLRKSFVHAFCGRKPARGNPIPVASYISDLRHNSYYVVGEAYNTAMSALTDRSYHNGEPLDRPMIVSPGRLAHMSQQLGLLPPDRTGNHPDKIDHALAQFRKRVQAIDPSGIDDEEYRTAVIRLQNEFIPAALTARGPFLQAARSWYAARPLADKARDALIGLIDAAGDTKNFVRHPIEDAAKLPDAGLDFSSLQPLAAQTVSPLLRMAEQHLKYPQDGFAHRLLARKAGLVPARSPALPELRQAIEACRQQCEERNLGKLGYYDDPRRSLTMLARNCDRTQQLAARWAEFRFAEAMQGNDMPSPQRLRAGR